MISAGSCSHLIEIIIFDLMLGSDSAVFPVCKIEEFKVSKYLTDFIMLGLTSANRMSGHSLPWSIRLDLVKETTKSFSISMINKKVGSYKLHI